MRRKKRSRTLEWVGIITLALAVHLFIFLAVKPEFFAAFKRSLSDDGPASSGRFAPNAIITIPIEIENDAETITPRPDATRQRAEQLEPTFEESEQQDAPPDGSTRPVTIDVGDVLGQSPTTLPGSAPNHDGVIIPPRPIQITWPDTRDLKHCLGHFIDVEIRVGESGEILEVRPPSGSYPGDCVQAAIESARRIVFQPGQKNGQPAELWTKVRIEFRRKR